MWAYALGVQFWEWLIRRASAWHSGAAGRRNMLSQPWPTKALGQNPIWFHCASLGEYEQILPVIQCWETGHSKHQILITFYSASGYNVIQPKEKNRWVVGFPGDLKTELTKFLSYFQPKLAVFTKAEIWPICLGLLSQNSIPAMLVAFRAGRSKNLALIPGKFVLNQMHSLACISCQDEESRTFLIKLGLNNVVADGDPRVGRTLDLQSQPLEWPKHIQWAENQPMIVLGSVWPPDLDLWEPILRSTPHINWVIAPHHWTTKIQKRLKKTFINAQLWNSNETKKASNILIINTVGVLSRVYKKASAAYVGGGFGRGIHSVLEPAAAGIPVAFGPRHSHSREAQAFLTEKVGTVLMKKEEAQAWIFEVGKKTVCDEVKEKLSKWFEKQTGTERKIVKRMDFILQTYTK